jgi:predicted transcriptional regulator
MYNINMMNDTKDKLISYLNRQKQATAHDLANYLEISRQALFKHLNKLLEENKIGKIGRPPKVYYFIVCKKKEEVYDINKELKEYINDNYLIITPAGEKKEGWEGFIYWCKKNNLPVIKTAHEYKNTLNKYKTWKET